MLDQIGSLKGAFDVKVQHNSLINDYYRSGCADPQSLLAQLTQAHDRARERDKKDKGRRKRDDDEGETYREDEDLSVLRYNQALICLQLRQHAQATLILEELFENIEPIDDFLAIKICFLLLELCLLQREPEQAVAVLTYLEKPNAFLTVLRSERPTAKGLEVRAGDEGVDPDEPKVRTAEADEAGDDSAGDGSDALGGATTERQAATSQTEASEGPLPSLAVGAFLPRHGRAPDTISRAEYKFFCLMYRARLAVALRNTKGAKKDAKGALEVLEQELRHAPLLTPHPHTTGPTGTKGEGGHLTEDALREGLRSQHHAMVNVLKAYLEYSRQNVRKAMKLLTLCQFNFAGSRTADSGQDDTKASQARRKSTDDEGEDDIPTDFHPAQDDSCSALFFNNLGCIHFMMRKPNLAAFYFQKALQAGPSPSLNGAASPGAGNILGAKAGLKLPGVLATRHWLDRRAEIAYNAGLQMLMRERPSTAFRCFEQCAPVFRTWPRLWLRLAECCIEIQRQSLAPSTLAEPRDAEPSGSGASASSTAASWSRVASRCGARGTELGGGARQLAWGIQGRGENRRWLLTTSHSPAIGRRAAAGEEEEGREPESEGAGGEATVRDGVLSGEGALAYAAMCLRNVLTLTQRALPEPAAPATAAAAAEASGEAANSGAAGSNKAPGASSGSGSRHQARDLSESEASLLEDVALAKFAYVRLCQHDHSAALRHSRRLLEKAGLLPQVPADAAKDPPASGKAQTGSAALASSDEADEARKNWTFQVQNLPHSSGASACSAKHPPSIGCITLAVLYAAEALLLSGKTSEARTLLSSFVSGDAAPRGLELQSNALAEIERASPLVVGAPGRPSVDADAADEPARAACGGLSPGASLGGMTPPGYLLHCAGSAASREGKGEAEKEKGAGKDGLHAALVMYEPCEFPQLGNTQCMLCTNLAALHIQDGNLDEAERACKRALQVQPGALAPLRTLTYILLRRGRHVKALECLKRSRLGS